MLLVFFDASHEMEQVWRQLMSSMQEVAHEQHRFEYLPKRWSLSAVCFISWHTHR